MSRIRLLLVDDDKDNLDAFAIVLGETYAVFGYMSASEALEAIDVAKPDVLVLDIGMHPVDGMQCLAAIRARPGYGDIPAVALTGFARDVERRRFLDGGFQVVVVKPVDSDDLVAVIGRVANARAPAARRPPVHARESGAVDRSGIGGHLDGGPTMTASRMRGPDEADG